RARARHLTQGVAEARDVDVVLHSVPADDDVADPQRGVDGAGHAREHRPARASRQQRRAERRGVDLADAALGEQHLGALQAPAQPAERALALLAGALERGLEARHLLAHGAHHRGDQRPPRLRAGGAGGAHRLRPALKTARPRKAPATTRKAPRLTISTNSRSRPPAPGPITRVSSTPTASAAPEAMVVPKALSLP